MIWNKEYECMDRAELEKIQLERLKALVEKVYNYGGYYSQKMKNANVKPEDIVTLKDIAKLPFTTKDDLRDNYPFGTFIVPYKDIVRVHASSGTTGKATVVGYTKNDLDMWADCVARAFTMAGVTDDDVIQIAYGYGLFTGGLGAHNGAEKVGAMVVPMSTGNTKKLITMMQDFGVTAIACTPSYLLHIAETLTEMNAIDTIKLRVAVCGAEPWTENMRKQIEDTLHIKAYDIYGLSEMMGPGVACDCEAHSGLHIAEDNFLAEIVSRDTLKPVEDGELGELVFTTLTKEGMPLIRYRTKDLTSISREKCSCGRTTARIARFVGRSDDMLIIRGVNVFPSQIETALLEVEEASPHYVMIVDRIGNLDSLEVQVELKDKYFSDEIKQLEAITKNITKTLKEAIGLAVKVKLVEPNSIERSMGKTQHVVDKRKLV